MRQIILAAAFILAATLASAQTFTRVTVLAENDRREMGTDTSVAVAVPADAVGDIGVELMMPLAAQLNVANQIRMTAYALIAGQWWLGPSMVWTGGPKVGKDGTINPTPRLGFPVNEPNGIDLRGVPLRIEIEVFLQQRAGVDVVFRQP